MAIDVVVTRVGTVSSAVAVRGHEITVDRPAKAGGGDAGPMGGEVFVAGLGGCFTSNLLALANDRDMALDDLRVAVSGDIEAGRFVRASVAVTAGARSDDELATLVADAEQQCLVANTIRSCVELTFTATRA